MSFIPPLAEWFPITTNYGDPTAAGPDAGSPHTAIDFGTPEGTPLYSIGEGVVLNPDDNPDHTTGGTTITVDYGNGLIVSFAHLANVFVKPGDRIAPAQMIGTTGNTGITTGAHLHMDAWLDGTKINPLDLFDWDKDSTTGIKYPTEPGRGPDIFGGIGGAIGGVVDMGAAVVAFIGAILNPENWARILAIFGGGLLVLIGGFMVWQST